MTVLNNKKRKDGRITYKENNSLSLCVYIYVYVYIYMYICRCAYMYIFLKEINMFKINLVYGVEGHNIFKVFIVIFITCFV
jgi:hypothetical protein